MSKGALFKRAVIDGVEIRATRGPAPREALYSPVASAYPVFVGGELRGYLVHQKPGWRSYEHRGWALRSLEPSVPARGGDSALQIAATSHQPASVGCIELLCKVPALIAGGRLPSAVEVAGKVERAVAVAVAWDAGEADRKAAEERRRARQREEIEERQEALRLGLESLRNRPDLSNIERAGLREAFSRLGLRSPVS